MKNASNFIVDFTSIVKSIQNLELANARQKYEKLLDEHLPQLTPSILQVKLQDRHDEHEHLLKAVLQGDVVAIKGLLGSGVNVHLKCSSGITPMQAVGVTLWKNQRSSLSENERLSIAAQLMRADLNFDIASYVGAIDMAIFRGFHQLANVLRSRIELQYIKDLQSLLHDAMKHCDVDTLLARQDRYLNDALSDAIYYQDRQKIAQLHDVGVDLNRIFRADQSGLFKTYYVKRDDKITGLTPMTFAITVRHRDMLDVKPCQVLSVIEALINLGADINKSDVFGWRPIDYTLYRKDGLEMAKELILVGASDFSLAEKLSRNVIDSDYRQTEQKEVASEFISIFERGRMSNRIVADIFKQFQVSHHGSKLS